ncbi:two-partner secretion domain-containing protein [Burkholderia sp. IMCC1007]|uniref:two-partner secretion domain-containing protein n=1 Tax=Burkholderia sp. IMCC1007 TaxID=3004104 RepID=UPI0022B39D0D|nr:GLUG motif-containing protein [Burkholderia sp. IMCC1007]
MNKTYALVWNQTRQCWSAVGETARRHGKSAGGKRLAATAVSLLGLAALPAFALPVGETITAGKADILRDTNGKSMSINQHTDKLVTNWQAFDVAAGERVTFHQPGTQSIALNRVIGNNGSQIHGNIDANGKVFLVNPNGVLFGSGAQLNVGGLVASTQNLSDADFLAGNYRFTGQSGASVVNNGRITAADGGSVALLGARVSNNGVIQARMGRVALGAGNAFKVNFDGNDLLSLQVEGGAIDAQASNGGLLKADGGEVLMSARAAGNLLNAVVNNTGTIEAKGLVGRGGRITLDGGTVNVAGKLDASAGSGAGGNVITRGEQVNVAAGTRVDTRGANGQTGIWTLEAANAGVAADQPTANTRGFNGNSNINGNTGTGTGNDVQFAGRSIDARTLGQNLDTTNVELVNTRNDLTVSGPVAWTGDTALKLRAKQGNVNLQQALSATGTNASLIVDAANGIRVNDAVKLTGRNAHLELDSTNGHTFAGDKAVVTLSGQNATYSSNGNAYKVLHTLADLSNVDANLRGRYVLGNTIDGANTAFHAIGGDLGFSGTFDGLGNTIGQLTISDRTHTSVGLFSQNAGRIANLVLSNIRVATSGSVYGVPTSVGALAGINAGTISNVTARNVTVTAGGPANIGGLIGANYGGTIEHAKVSGYVGGGPDVLSIGGLVGENMTLLGDAPVVATIRDSRADVQVNAMHDGAAGGLVGLNTGWIERSSSTGRVIATGSRAVAGGLVGISDDNGIITASSSSADVLTSRNAVAGGLVGINAATVSASSANGKVTVGDHSSAGGLVGSNTGDIDTSTANGTIIATTFGTAGGLVGTNSGSVRQSQANGSVTAGNASEAGGLVGRNAGTVADSRANGAVKAGDLSLAGGLIGVNARGSVARSSASGSVEAGANSNVGGLVGQLMGKIDRSNATGSAKGGDDSLVGGLVGNVGGVITASSSSGNVSGGRFARLGGLAGGNFGFIYGSSTTSHVNVTPGYGQIYGPLVGLNYGTVKP